jgi:2-desacetyl-2-hydroxyethyl bacteriochlorophyllide A dehydrogenase
MKTIILNEVENLEILEKNRPNISHPNQVLLKIQAIGICGTDYHAYRGKQPFFSYPRILGHEIGAEVVEVGEKVKKIQIGEKVSIRPYINCGKCGACEKGKTNCCENLKVIGVHTDGGMQEFFAIDENQLHVSKYLSFEQLALVETLAIGCHAVNRASPEKSDTVLVIGAGPIGLAIIQFLQLRSIPFGVLDLNEDRLAFVNKSFSPLFLVKNEMDLPKPCSIIFDATGNKTSMENTLNIVAFGGKIIFVGLHLENVNFQDTLFHRKEISLLASRNALPTDFDYIIEQIETGKIDTMPWISHRADLEEFPEKIKEWLNPESKVIKAVLNL